MKLGRIHPGTYEFQRDTGQIFTQEVLTTQIPPPISLESWQFHTLHRLKSGLTRQISMQITPCDWRLIPRLRFCSSVGYYRSEIFISEEYFQPNMALFLCTGRVGDVAEIRVNSHDLPPLFCYPYEIEITPYLHKGINSIEIAITPCLRNQLEGYKPWILRHTRMVLNRLSPSGLLAPISIISKIKIQIDSD